MADIIHLDSMRLSRPPAAASTALVVHRPNPDETIRKAADQHMVDRVLAFVESKMETTLHRPLEPRDRVTIIRMLALAQPEPCDG